MNKRDIVIYLSYLYDGDWEKIYAAIHRNDYDYDNEIIKKRIALMKCGALTIFDENYPKYLFNVPHPPFVIYYYGDISLLYEPSKNVSVIGTRKNSAYGRDGTISIVSELADKFTIVSGLAKGIDSISHETAINYGGKTIAILGSGIDYCYPPENEELYLRIKNNKENLIISEYPEKTIPDPSKFPDRNRLIAGLSDYLIITEAYSRSGTSITANFALAMGRTICCLPTKAFEDSLCNQLINDGARLINSLDDIYDELGIKLF